MPRWECMPAFLVGCPPQALRLQDGPGMRFIRPMVTRQDSNLRPLREGQPSYRWTNGP